MQVDEEPNHNVIQFEDNKSESDQSMKEQLSQQNEKSNDLPMSHNAIS